MKKEKLYSKIYNDIMHKIKTNEYKVGDKLPTELELANFYGVSRITVARALNDLAAINIVYRVKKCGTIVNGKLDRKNKKLIVPVVLPFPESYNSIFKGIEAVALKNNVYTPFYNTKNNIAKERAALESIKINNPDGVIVYPCSSMYNIDVYGEILSKGIPIICIDRNIIGLNTPLITTTNAKSTEQVVSMLVSQGHSKIGFFSINNRMAITEKERFEGFCSGMIKNNVKIERAFLFDSTDMRKQELTLSQAQQVKKFNKYVSKCLDEYEKMPEKPTAICCVNDKSMYALIAEALSRNIKVPDQLTITGFDCIDEDFIRSNHIICIKQNFMEIGSTAMNLLLQILDGQHYLSKTYIPGILIN
ncbi:MAG: GntR family transcriptional regulator [Clostridia bacterium]|nr:GntR family transcriptional regulator [Clostridia bacterium]